MSPIECSVEPPILRALGDIVGHRKDLASLLIQQQMVIAEVRAADVPMETLRFDVQTKDVGKKYPQRAGNLGGGLAAQIERALGAFHCYALSHGLIRLLGTL